MRTLLNTLYVTTPQSYLHLDNDTVRIDLEHETKLRVPLHHLGGIVVFGNVLVSPALMHRLADNGQSLVLLDGNGRFKARLEGPVSGNILLRQAHHQKAGEPTFALAVARACVAGKLRNSRQVLLRGAREAKDEDDASTLARGADDLAASLRALPVAENLDALRGVEGEAARQYFGCINRLLRADARDDFSLDGRTRRPPRDRMNALLSFLYAMLMNDCRSAVESVGLDPQLGFLHAVRPGRAALALDLMEEFRHQADRLAVTLVNRGQVKAGDFTLHEGGGVTLAEAGRKVVVVAWQERKQEELSHPLMEEPLPLGLIPQLQARFMARTLRGDMETYLPFLLR
ncbi:MAG: type I-C CRISPR-associated endonuclease Cas1 [Rhodocyclales bacterium]|nr:type I-C CRISPR-associated endonuclease Cas1 [Rhodocyclales bacterium]